MEETKPITEAELVELEECVATRNSLPSTIHLSRSDPNESRVVCLINLLANEVPRLIAEIRAMRTAVDCMELEKLGIEGLGDALFSANVEIDNLRKMLADEKQRLALIKEISEEAGRLVQFVIKPRLEKLEAIARDAKRLLEVDGGDPCKHWDAHENLIVRENLVKGLADLDPKPVPMCKADPLGDLFPPAAPK